MSKTTFKMIALCAFVSLAFSACRNASGGGGWSIDWATERPQTAVEQTEPAKQEDPQTEPSQPAKPNPLPQEEEQQPEPKPKPTEPSEQPEPTPTEPSEQPTEPTPTEPEQPTEPSEQPIQPGDVRLDNGTWKTKDEVLAWTEVPAGVSVLGVAAFSEGGTTLCVGVKTGTALSYDDADKYAKSENGKLPTNEQFKKIYEHKDAVNATLKKLHELNPVAYPNASLGESYYWSSSPAQALVVVTHVTPQVYVFTFANPPGEWNPMTVIKEGYSANALVLREFPSASK